METSYRGGIGIGIVTARRRPGLRPRVVVTALALLLAMSAFVAAPLDAGVSSVPVAMHEVAQASSNWSGYVVTKGPYGSVSGSWVVPAVAPTSRATYSALWLGLDGVDSAGLIQVGTEQDYYGGRAHYGAWWEVLPAAAVPIRTLSVRPGDTIRASIARVAPGRWRITIGDSRGGRFTTIRSYAGRGTTAEWIEEAPVVDGHLAVLAHTGTARFDHATVGGASPALSLRDAVVLARGSSILLAPSAPDADRDGFAVRVGASSPDSPPS